MGEDTRVDPDVWTIASLSVAIVAMFGTLGQFAIAASAALQKPRIIPEPDPKSGIEHLREGLESACKNSEKLLRFLGKLERQPTEPLNAAFRYGEVGLLLEQVELLEYIRLTTALTADLERVQFSVFHLYRHCPAAAARLGEDVLKEVQDLKDRVNGFYSGQTNDEVLSSCITLLRTFTAILVRMEGN